MIQMAWLGSLLSALFIGVGAGLIGRTGDFMPGGPLLIVAAFALYAFARMEGARDD